MLFLLFVSVVLAQNACYYAAGKRAGSAIVPCSGGSSVASCCQIGDLCLSDSACWNPRYNITYLYGCTDSSYTDANCPWKCGSDFANAPYVGLNYCSNTTRNEWSCTHPPSSDPAIAAFNPQQCLNDSIIAFAGPSSLQPILSLPTNVGAATLYFSQVNPTSYTPVTGYTPTSTARSTASKPSSVELVSSTSRSSTSGSRTASTAASTATPTSSQSSVASPESSGLSTGAKAGIGAGIGGAALAIAAVVITWMILRRRKATPTKQDTETSSATYSAIPEKPSPTGPSELPASTKANIPAELGDASRPLHSKSDVPSELGDESQYGTPAPTYTSWSRPAPGQQVHELPTDNTR